MAAMSIQAKQDAIVSEYESLGGWEERYKRIIQFGRELPQMDDAHKTDDNQVRGCTSTVWLHAELNGARVRYLADSDAMIVRGLVHLLTHVYSDETPSAILATPPDFIERLGLNANLSQNRANGLAAMTKQIKAYAMAYQVKLKMLGVPEQ